MRIVDGDVEVADAGQRPARDDEIVERHVADVVDRAAVAQDHALERHAFADLVVAGLDPGEHGVEIARLGLGEEPDLAQVDAEDRDVHLGHGTDGAQERAVATQDDEGIGRRELPQQDRHVVGLGLPLVDLPHLAPAGRAGAELDGRLDRRVVGEPEPLDGHAADTVAIRSPISAQPGPGARWTRNSRLPSGPRSGEAMTSRVPRPAAWARSHDPLEDLAMDGRVADDAVVRAAAAGFELWLDERDDLAAGAERGGDRRQDEVQRDERDVDRGQADGLGQRGRGQRPGVRALHRDDAWVAAQRLGELGATDVEGVHAGRAALEQDVREAAGRGADVEADQPGRVDPERVERGGELVAASADVGLGRVDADGGRRVDQVARFAVEAGGVALPHPDLAGQHQRLRAAARLDQPTLHEQLVEPDPRGLRLGRRAVGRTHAPIVAQPASPGLTAGTRGVRSIRR